MRRDSFWISLVVLLGICAPAMAQTSPYEIVESSYAPYMDATDPLAMPMKIKSLASDPYKFWRGSKDLFARWCKTNAADWLADSKATLPNHGDLHLGNIGSYAAEGKLGTMAFGMVDFDDSGRLPFQFELLQGLITLQLTAKQNQITMTSEQKAQLAEKLFATYKIAVNSRRNATDLLAEDADVKKMLKSDAPYADELKDYLDDQGKFLPVVLTGAGKVKEVLRPADDRADAFAAAIAQAMVNSPEMKALFAYSDAPTIRKKIKGIVQRTRLGSSGSQGLKKYFILLERPLKGIDHDLILYLKQEIPCAAERAGLIPRDPRTPGQRCADDMRIMTEPRPYFDSWCELGTESYWVHFKEPWSVELDVANFKTYDDLLHAAVIWANVAGSTHREEGRFETILPRLTPELLATIRARSDAYVTQLQQEFEQYKSDPRTVEQIKRADETLAAIEAKN